MIKLDIINEVVNKTGITKTKAEMAVETVFESMKKALGHGDRIELIILSHDNEDTVLVRVDVDATVVAKEIRVEPTHVASIGQ